MRWLMIPIAFILLATIAFAQTIPQHIDKYVNDYASMFTQGQIVDLRSLFVNVEANTTAEMTLLTIDAVSPYDMSQYAQEVFDQWKIGKADTDNGLLILYAKAENRIWVSTGYGLEGILPDSKVGRILDDTFVPARADNRTAEGIILAAQQYAAVINENADEVRSGQASPQFSFDPTIYVFILLFVVLPIFSIISQRWLTPKCQYGHKTKFDHIEGDVVIYICKDGHSVRKKRKRSAFFFIGGLGGSGGGFGGGGFGGGGSGGGGAGR